MSSLNHLKERSPFILWFTGLSGSGKSTLSQGVYDVFKQHNRMTYLLDGDVMRQGLCKDLDFSDAGRKENIRRISEVSKLFVDAGVVVITAFISPFEADRAFCRSLVSKGQFIEVFVDCPLSICEDRDPKGLYKQARAGHILNFTGIDSVYERPEDAEIVVKTGENSVDECVGQILRYI